MVFTLSKANTLRTDFYSFSQHILCAAVKNTGDDHADRKTEQGDAQDANPLVRSLYGRFLFRPNSGGFFCFQLFLCGFHKVGIAAELIAHQKHIYSRRHDALVRKTKAIKAYVQAEMETSGREKIRTDVFTVSVQHSPDKVHVIDETKIPPQFYQTTRRLDKIEVLRSLKAGQAVPGCELTQGSHLRIR